MSVLVEEASAEVTVVTLNRPEVLNALDSALLEGLSSAFRDVSARAVVLTGAGRAFSTGADLKARASMTLGQWREHHELLREAFATVRRCPVPVLAAVEGFALAGGFELALSCDLVLAGADAEMGLPEVTRGIMPGAGGTTLLPLRIGPARAKELIFSGRRIDAATAERWGIVARVTDAGAAFAGALELAAVIARNAPLAVRAAKRALNGADELDAYWSCVPSEDQREGIAAFLERRAPRFAGR